MQNDMARGGGLLGKKMKTKIEYIREQKENGGKETGVNCTPFSGYELLKISQGLYSFI